MFSFYRKYIQLALLYQEKVKTFLLFVFFFTFRLAINFKVTEAKLSILDIYDTKEKKNSI